MSRTAKGSGFKMRSGNSPLFKEMGSSPLQAGDAGIIAAATPEQTIEPIDFTIKSPEIKIGKIKKKKDECPEGQVSDGKGGCVDDDNGDDNGNDNGDDSGNEDSE